METPYPYMDRMADLWETIGEAGTIDDVIKEDARKIVFEIGENVQKAPVFVEKKAEYDSFCQAIETGIEDRLERLKACYHHLLERVVNAPTRLHLGAIVIMVMPALAKYLQDYLDHPETLKRGNIEYTDDKSGVKFVDDPDGKFTVSKAPESESERFPEFPGPVPPSIQ